MWLDPLETADLVKFLQKKSLMDSLIFLCSKL